MSARITVEVVYALPDRQWLVALEAEPGTTLLEAIRLSGLPGRIPGFAWSGLSCGVFGKVEPEPGLRRVVAGDRIEIYRALIKDPKEARRERAAKAAAARRSRV